MKQPLLTKSENMKVTYDSQGSGRGWYALTIEDLNPPTGWPVFYSVAWNGAGFSAIGDGPALEERGFISEANRLLRDSYIGAACPSEACKVWAGNDGKWYGLTREGLIFQVGMS